MINKLGCHPSTPYFAQAMGQDLAGNGNLHATLWVVSVVYGESQLMDVLPSHSYILEVHGQGLTSLGHDQYTMIPHIHTIMHPRFGIRFDGNKNCKPATL
jgi:hypothetical protein